MSSGAEEAARLLACGVCGAQCKRGVSLPCCTAQACRACGVKQATAARKCWNAACGLKITSECLVNDHILREAVAKFEADGRLPKETIDALKARNKTRQAPVLIGAPATPIKTAVKVEAAASPTTSSLTASSPTASSLTAAVAKRKPEDNGFSSSSGGDKKARLGGDLRIYVEIESVYNRQGEQRLTQIACCDDMGGGFFKPTLPSFFWGITDPKILEKYYFRKGTNAAKREAYFILPGYQPQACEYLSTALKYFIAYVKELHTAHPDKSIVLVALRNRSLHDFHGALYHAFKDLTPRKGLEAVLSGVATVEDYLAQTKSPTVLQTLNELLGDASTKVEHCGVTAYKLKRLVAQLEAKHGSLVSSTVKKPLSECQSSRKYKAWRDLFILDNSNTFIANAAARTAVAQADSLDAAEHKKIPDYDEEMVGRGRGWQQRVKMKVVFDNAVFPVMTHPVLVRLVGLPNNVKAVTFEPNKRYCKNRDQPEPVRKVFWKKRAPWALFDFIPPCDPAELLTCAVNPPTAKKFSIQLVIGKADPVPASKVLKEDRPFSKVVLVDLVLIKDITLTGDKASLVALPVSVVPREDAVTTGSATDLVFRPTDVFLVNEPTVKGLEMFTSIFSVGKGPLFENKARIIYLQREAIELKSGQVLGSAELFLGEIRGLNEVLKKFRRYGWASDKGVLESLYQGIVPKFRKKADIKTLKKKRAKKQKKMGAAHWLVKEHHDENDEEEEEEEDDDDDEEDTGMHCTQPPVRGKQPYRFQPPVRGMGPYGFQPPVRGMGPYGFQPPVRGMKPYGFQARHGFMNNFPGNRHPYSMNMAADVEASEINFSSFSRGGFGGGGNYQQVPLRGQARHTPLFPPAAHSATFMDSDLGRGEPMLSAAEEMRQREEAKLQEHLLRERLLEAKIKREEEKWMSH